LAKPAAATRPHNSATSRRPIGVERARNSHSNAASQGNRISAWGRSAIEIAQHAPASSAARGVGVWIQRWKLPISQLNDTMVSAVSGWFGTWKIRYGYAANATIATV